MCASHARTPAAEPALRRRAGRLARALAAPVLLIVAVLGSIFFGVASPSEAAGVGAAGATALALLRRSLDGAVLREVSRRTARTTSFIFAILTGASCFAVVLRGLGGDQVIEAAVTGLGLGATGLVLLLMAVCLQTSFLTPPVGPALFYLQGVAPPGVELRHLYRGVLPFVGLQLLGLAILFTWPELVTWLPDLLYR